MEKPEICARRTCNGSIRAVTTAGNELRLDNKAKAKKVNSRRKWKVGLRRLWKNLQPGWLASPSSKHTPGWHHLSNLSSSLHQEVHNEVPFNQRTRGQSQGLRTMSEDHKEENEDFFFVFSPISFPSRGCTVFFSIYQVKRLMTMKRLLYIVIVDESSVLRTLWIPTLLYYLLFFFFYFLIPYGYFLKISNHLCDLKAQNNKYV